MELAQAERQKVTLENIRPDSADLFATCYMGEIGSIFKRRWKYEVARLPSIRAPGCHQSFSAATERMPRTFEDTMTLIIGEFEGYN
jgi:hypothetical protein